MKIWLFTKMDFLSYRAEICTGSFRNSHKTPLKP